MVDSKKARDLIRELEGITEKDHFGSDAFSANKRIFATVWHDAKKVNLRFDPEEQRRFLESDSEAFSEIDNAWGRQGWTSVHLEFVSRSMFLEAVRAAYILSAVKTASSKKSLSKSESATKRAKKPVARIKAGSSK